MLVNVLFLDQSSGYVGIHFVVTLSCAMMIWIHLCICAILQLKKLAYKSKY